LSIETLLSALASRQEKGSSVFNRLWTMDVGVILESFLSTPHFLELWLPQQSTTSIDSLSAGSRKVRDTWVELRHKWMDVAAAETPMEDSGLCELFQKHARLEMQLVYLDVYKHLDNFVFFLAALENYRRLSHIGGDAGMYRLRDSLHHLLQELERALEQLHQGVVRVVDHAMAEVMRISLTDSVACGRRGLWIERLALIDVDSFIRGHVELVRAIQMIRFLSGAARLPALERSCEQSLQKAAIICDSAEFRARCAHELPQEALPSMKVLASLENDVIADAGVPHVDDCMEPRVSPLIESLTDDITCLGVASASPPDVLQPSSTYAKSQLDSVSSACAPSASLGTSSTAPETSVTGASDYSVLDAGPAALPGGRKPDTASVPMAVLPRELHPSSQAEMLADAERKYYDALFMMGYCGESLDIGKVAALLSRANLSGMMRMQIMKDSELNRQLSDTGLDIDGLIRLGRLVAHGQGGGNLRDKIEGVALVPGPLPAFQGVVWEAQREKLGITQDLTSAFGAFS